MKAFPILTAILALGVASPVWSQKKTAEYYFRQGEASMEDNKYTLALAHFNECLRLDPYYWDAYPARAAAKERLGDAKGALTDFNIYVDRSPDDQDALIGRGVLRYQLGQYELAREDFLKLLKSPPVSTSKVLFRQTSEGTDKMFTIQSSNHADFFNYLGLIETRLKGYQKARIYLDSAISLAPEDAQYYVNRGMLKENMQDTSGAVADYRTATKIDPSNSSAIHNLAVIRREKVDPDESLQMLNEAIIQSPSLPAPYAARAYYEFRHQHYKEALRDYDRVIELSKDDEESWLYRGMVKEKLKDLDGAFVDYTESITLKNDYAKAWMARGTLLTKLNRIPEAIEDYSVAILWYPEFGLAYYNRGIAHQKTGNLNLACEDLRMAEKLRVKVAAWVMAAACK